MIAKIFDKIFSVISKNSLFSAFSKIIAISAQCVITAILSRTLSKEEFGLWAILGHFIIIMSMFDFGIGGGGLRNALAKYNITKDTEHLQKRAYFSSFFLMTGIYTVLFFLWIFFVKNHLNLFFHIKESHLLEQLEWVSFFIFAIFIKNSFSIYGTGFVSYQEHTLKAIIDSIEHVLLVCMVILVFFLKGTFSIFLISYYFLYLSIAIFGFIFFLKIRNWQWMNISIRDLREMIPLLRINGLFWVQNLVSLLLFSFSPFLISFFGNLELGGEYSLIYRFCCLFIGIHFAFLNPLWSAYTDAFYKQNFHWIETNFMKSLKLTGVFLGLGGIVIIFIYKPIIYLWTGKNLSFTTTVIASCLWMLLYGVINCFSVLLNAINKIRRQILFLLIGALLNIVIASLLGNLFGITGVVVAGIIALIPLLCSNIIEVFSIRLREVHENSAKNINN